MHVNNFTSSQAPTSLFSSALGTTGNSTQGAGGNGLAAVIDQLAKLLSQNGQLDKTSPLGNLLAKEMGTSGTGNNGFEAIKAALEKLIHDKLGANAGAAEQAGTSPAGTSQSDGSTGQSGLMTQVLNALAKASLDNLLTPQGEGSTVSRNDQPILDKVAQFMDANKGVFGTPQAGSWADQLKQGNSLSADQTSQVRAALDLIGQQLTRQQADASAFGDDSSSSTSGGLGTPSASQADSNGVDASDATDSTASTGNPSNLGQLLEELLELGLQSALSGGAANGNGNGGGLGSPVSGGTPSTTSSNGQPTTQPQSSDLAQLLGGLLEKGLEAALQGQAGNSGSNVQQSAQQTAGQIVDTLLQGNQTQAVA